MKRLALIAVCVLFAQGVWAADCTVTLSWDGKDALGNTESSLPVHFEVVNADTLDVLTSADVNGAVTDYAMPGFSIVVPDNQTITLRVYATATDSAPIPNESAPSEIVTVTLTGADTSAPVQPVINIQITQ